MEFIFYLSGLGNMHSAKAKVEFNNKKFFTQSLTTFNFPFLHIAEKVFFFYSWALQIWVFPEYKVLMSPNFLNYTVRSWSQCLCWYLYFLCVCYQNNSRTNYHMMSKVVFLLLFLMKMLLFINITEISPMEREFEYIMVYGWFFFLLSF